MGLVDRLVRELAIVAHRILPGRQGRTDRMVRRIDRTRETFSVPTILIPANVDGTTRRREAEALLLRALGEYALPVGNDRVLIVLTTYRGDTELDQHTFAGRRGAVWDGHGEEILAMLDNLDEHTRAELQVAPLARLTRHIVQALRADQAGTRLTPFSADPHD